MKRMRIKQVLLAGAGIVAASALTSAVPNGGTITGRVTYEGTPAKQKPIDMSKEPSCAQQYSTLPTTETVVTGPNNVLGNVIVYISAGAPDESAPSQAAVFTQKGCRYAPHLLPLLVNQELRVMNEDQTSHNIHPMAKINREWNKSQPAGTAPIVDKFDKPEFVPVKCNVHPWMHATFAILKNSHYSITGTEGTFELPDLPPGTYTITAWHESYGDLTQELTITGNETKTVNFVFKARPY
jgi:Carboxypeptidase regulatory-like domain